MDSRNLLQMRDLAIFRGWGVYVMWLGGICVRVGGCMCRGWGVYVSEDRRKDLFVGGCFQVKHNNLILEMKHPTAGFIHVPGQ